MTQSAEGKPLLIYPISPKEIWPCGDRGSALHPHAVANRLRDESLTVNELDFTILKKVTKVIQEEVGTTESIDTVLVVSTPPKDEEVQASLDTKPVLDAIDETGQRSAFEDQFRIRVQDVVVVDNPYRRQAVVELLRPRLKQYHDRAPIFIASGPATPAIEIGILIASLDGLNSRHNVRALEAIQPNDSARQSEVNQIPLPDVIARGMATDHVLDLLEQGRMRVAIETLRAVGMAEDGSEIATYCDAIDGYLQRDKQDALRELANAHAETEVPQAHMGEGRWLALAHQLLDEIEFGWKANERDWYILTLISLLVVEVVPKAWSEAFKASHDDAAVEQHAKWVDAETKRVEGHIKGGLPISGNSKPGMHFDVRALTLTGLSTLRVDSRSMALETHELEWSELVSPEASAIWCVARQALQGIRNDMFHRGVIVAVDTPEDESVPGGSVLRLLSSRTTEAKGRFEKILAGPDEDDDQAPDLSCYDQRPLDAVAAMKPTALFPGLANGRLALGTSCLRHTLANILPSLGDAPWGAAENKPGTANLLEWAWWQLEELLTDAPQA